MLSAAGSPLLGPGQLVPGLSNPALKTVFLLLAAGLFIWGFERYRTTFSRLEFLVATLMAIGLVTVAVAPDIYGTLAGLLNLESRFLVVSLLANTTFVVLILYVITLVRGNQLSIGELTRRLTIDRADDELTEDRPIAIVIPAYNEAENIAGVVSSLPDTLLGKAVQPIVVSDGSTDATVERARFGEATVVEHLLNQGQGGALKTGFEIAARHGAEIVVTMDADGQHPPGELENLVRPILEDRADYVVGSRYLGRDNSRNSVTRRLGIRAFTWVIKMMTKTDITDCTNGYRAIRASALEGMTLTEERFSAPELLIEARKQGLRIMEIPVTIREREGGETKKPKLGYALGLARTIFVTWIR